MIHHREESLLSRLERLAQTNTLRKLLTVSSRTRQLDQILAQTGTCILFKGGGQSSIQSKLKLTTTKLE